MVTVGCVAVISLVSAVSTGVQSQERGSRRIVVLSDLHMGEGRGAGGEWSPHEDFRWADDFHPFLTALAAEDRGPTDLILNGDTFELARSSEIACEHTDPALGCTQTEALARLERVLTAHASELAALGDFAGSGDNRVVLVPGEEDAALLFPEVGVRAVAAFGAPRGPLRQPWRSHP